MTEEKIYKCKLCDFTASKKPIIANHYRWSHPGAKVKLESKIKPSGLTTPDEIATALLRRVVVWATEKEEYINQLKGMKELRTKAQRLEQENRSLRDERDRLLKIHNEQVKGKAQFTSTEELKRLAGGQPYV